MKKVTKHYLKVYEKLIFEAFDPGTNPTALIQPFIFNHHAHFFCVYWVTQKLPQIYTANHATFPIRLRKITVQICGNF